MGSGRDLADSRRSGYVPIRDVFLAGFGSAATYPASSAHLRLDSCSRSVTPAEAAAAALTPRERPRIVHSGLPRAAQASDVGQATAPRRAGALARSVRPVRLAAVLAGPLGPASAARLAESDLGGSGRRAAPQQSPAVAGAQDIRSPVHHRRLGERRSLGQRSPCSSVTTNSPPSVRLTRANDKHTGHEVSRARTCAAVNAANGSSSVTTPPGMRG